MWQKDETWAWAPLTRAALHGLVPALAMLAWGYPLLQAFAMWIIAVLAIIPYGRWSRER